MTPLVLPYLEHQPVLGQGIRAAPGTTIIGRSQVADSVEFGRLTVLRGDGEWIEVGPDCWFGSRSTVHIADEDFGAVVGAGTLVGRYALVHACTLHDGVILGDAAVVMDRSVVGADAVIAAGALVPPGKTLDGGWLHAGNPARPVRALEAGEVGQIRTALRNGARSPATSDATDPLPPLDDEPYRPESGPGPLFGCGGRFPTVPEGAYVAPTAAVWGDVRLGRDASVWFSTALRAGPGRIVVGERTNIQDNTIVDVAEADATVAIGDDVTIGHNVRLEACRVGDRCLIGMGATVCSGAVIEDDAIVGARALVGPGTVVRTGWIWAGRPATAFREVRAEEADYFRRGKEGYERYARDYLAGDAAG